MSFADFTVRESCAVENRWEGGFQGLYISRKENVAAKQYSTVLRRMANLQIIQVEKLFQKG